MQKVQQHSRKKTEKSEKPKPKLVEERVERERIFADEQPEQEEQKEPEPKEEQK